MVQVDGVHVARLLKDGRYQVELCCLQAGAAIPTHVHEEADTIEVGVVGAVRLLVDGIDPFERVSDLRLPSFVRRRGISIPAGVPHSGVVLPCGAWFLSVQRWHNEPRSVLTDYKGARLGAEHESMLGRT